MLSWIFASQEYSQLYHQYFQEFLSQYFDSGYFAEEMDRVTEMISSYVERDPTKFCSYEEFETGVQTLREFCLLRAESVQGQLDGSIPSTSDGQSEDSAALVDASQLNISDMGSMNGNMGGMGGGDRPENMEGMEKPSGSPEDGDPSEEEPREGEEPDPSQGENSQAGVPENGAPQKGEFPGGRPEQPPDGGTGGGGFEDFAKKTQNAS